MADSLPAVLRDLAGALEAELMADAAAADEIDPAVRAEFLSLKVQKSESPRVQGSDSSAGPGLRSGRESERPKVPDAAIAVSDEVLAGCADIESIARLIGACEACPLSKTRTRVVPGVGRLSPDVMFIGEGPGADEDRQGLPFVGRAGELLTKMIAAMGYAREEVFIANVVKCRPPDNRKPTPQEMSACMPYLRRQVALVNPKTIVALGATAVQGLFNTTQGINSLRGRWMSFQGIPVMPTFHPAYLLRMPVAKRDAWSDLKQVMARLKGA